MSVIAVEPIFPLAFGGVFAETGIPLFYWYPTLIAENSVYSSLVFESSSILPDASWYSYSAMNVVISGMNYPYLH